MKMNMKWCFWTQVEITSGYGEHWWHRAKHGEANNVADNLSIGPQSLTVTHQLRLITVDQGKHNTRISWVSLHILVKSNDNKRSQIHQLWLNNMFLVWNVNSQILNAVLNLLCRSGVCQPISLYSLWGRWHLCRQFSISLYVGLRTPSRVSQGRLHASGLVIFHSRPPIGWVELDYSAKHNCFC